MRGRLRDKQKARSLIRHSLWEPNLLPSLLYAVSPRMLSTVPIKTSIRQLHAYDRRKGTPCGGNPLFGVSKYPPPAKNTQCRSIRSLGVRTWGPFDCYGRAEPLDSQIREGVQRSNPLCRLEIASASWRTGPVALVRLVRVWASLKKSSRLASSDLRDDGVD